MRSRQYHCQGSRPFETSQGERNLDMTSFSHLYSGSGGRLVQSRGYTSSLRNIAGRLASAWRHHRDELEMENLPFDLRKDIGFPSVDDNGELTSIVRKVQ